MILWGWIPEDGQIWLLLILGATCYLFVSLAKYHASKTYQILTKREKRCLVQYQDYIQDAVKHKKVMMRFRFTNLLQTVFVSTTIITYISTVTAEAYYLFFQKEGGHTSALREFQRDIGAMALTLQMQRFEQNSVVVKAQRQKLSVTPFADSPTFREGDIAVSTKSSSVKCFAQSCLWPKSVDGHVYVAYNLSTEYSDIDRMMIEAGMEDVANSTCIRFVPCNHESNYLNIQSKSG
ncbi:UNVERIFIED_CONTAM: hypothetical protein FKN15_038036 [Acipenser sinensis]